MTNNKNSYLYFVVVIVVACCLVVKKTKDDKNNAALEINALINTASVLQRKGKGNPITMLLCNIVFKAYSLMQYHDRSQEK